MREFCEIHLADAFSLEQFAFHCPSYEPLVLETASEEQIEHKSDDREKTKHGYPRQRLYRISVFGNDDVGRRYDGYGVNDKKGQHKPCGCKNISHRACGFKVYFR